MSSRAKYQQVADILRQAIRQGKYQPGGQLPLERDLCVEFSVSRITIKRAVDELVRGGLVVKRRGAGTFVKSLDDHAMHKLSRSEQFGGFSDYYQGHPVHTEVLHFAIVHPVPEVAVQLGMSEDDFVYDIQRLRCADGGPVVIEYTQMPIDLIAGLKEGNLQDSIYRYIEETLGLHIQSAHRTVRAVMPTAAEQKLLGIDERMPLLEVAQVAFLSDGRPFEYSLSRHRGDKMKFKAISVR
ncbi:putative GntR family transcriptional regulator [Selenomonas ruminantium subsp. lactilytica TAM6421]|uniref:Putative GntR family transcriptional regulator n=1 Tax=Selenomonas ruminantium subsp. lactilytica (strain NBRC 103574 / TAM6421) TaxID=927704 RepID=I0GS91_SELRL|nr:GntR family transcriptional regulator [Selenomonas ruminantium]BAL83628.1 putative GntR family transcriptional regulator [Selenomonas ruminantium subsp. lactilytica TAM6421]